jgi:hypothetical protein
MKGLHLLVIACYVSQILLIGDVYHLTSMHVSFTVVFGLRFVQRFLWVDVILNDLDVVAKKMLAYYVQTNFSFLY